MPHSSQPRDVLHVRHPGDLIDLIPYLLGFHPRSSLVIVGLREQLVAATARADLADLAAGRLELSETIDLVLRSGARRVIMAIFDDAAEIGPEGPVSGRGMVQEIRRHTVSAGQELCDAFLVARGRWWSYLCENPTCCPPAGQPLAGDSSVAAAAATYAGLVARPSRSDVMAVLEPLPTEHRDNLEPLIAHYENIAAAAILDGRSERLERSVKRALFAAARDSDRALFPGRSGSVGDEDICRFAVALVETSVRDAVWLAIERRHLDGRSLWREIARRAPQPYDVAPLFLYGWVSWREGNGTLAAVAAERALASEPGYSAAELLLSAVRSGLDPRRTPRLRLPRPA